MCRSNIFDTHLAKVINFVRIHVLHFELMYTSVTLLFFYAVPIHTLKHNHGYAAKYCIPIGTTVFPHWIAVYSAVRTRITGIIIVQLLDTLYACPQSVFAPIQLRKKGA